MANFSVMADVPNPVFDSNGNPFSGAVLKAFLPGTTTSTSIAIDSAGGSPQASITYNAEGKLEVTGNEILPYIDRKHKWGIFANATDAAANTPFYMGPFDNVEQVFDDSTDVIKSFDTLAAAVAATNLNDGNTVGLKERTTGNGGGAIWDVVLLSTVTPNTFNIVVSTGVPTLALVLRIDNAIDFKTFGAIGDDVADDTTFLQAVFDFSAANNKVIVDDTGSIYKYTANITTTGATLFMRTNSTFKGVNAFITLQGTKISQGNVTAAANIGDDALVFSSVSGLAVRDIIITDVDVANSFSSHRAEYHDGEFFEIADIAGSVVTSTTPLQANYTGISTDKLFKVTPICVWIDGGKFINSGTSTFSLRTIHTAYSELRLDSAELTSTGSSALALDRAYKTNIIGGRFFKDFQSGDDYGINVINSQSVLIDGINSYAGRHAITTGGDAADANPPCRDIRITNSRLENEADASIYCADFHGNTTDSFYDNCTIVGAVGLAGENCSCKNSTVYTHNASNDIPLSYHELVGGTLEFKNNRVYQGLGLATEVVGITASALSQNIDRNYKVVVDGLELISNSNITQIVNAVQDTNNIPNEWVLRNFADIGGLSLLTSALRFVAISGGRDATRIVIADPADQLVSPVEWLTLSGTTLPSASFELPFEEGLNSNGSFVKMTDGTMICTFDFTVASTALDTSFLGGFRSGGLTWTFPEAFTAAPPGISILPKAATAFAASESSTTTTSTLFFLTAVTTQTAATRNAKLTAIGRYF